MIGARFSNNCSEALYSAHFLTCLIVRGHGLRVSWRRRVFLKKVSSLSWNATHNFDSIQETTAVSVEIGSPQRALRYELHLGSNREASDKYHTMSESTSSEPVAGGWTRIFWTRIVLEDCQCSEIRSANQNLLFQVVHPDSDKHPNPSSIMRPSDGSKFYFEGSSFFPVKRDASAPFLWRCVISWRVLVVERFYEPWSDIDRMIHRICQRKFSVNKSVPFFRHTRWSDEQGWHAVLFSDVL